MTMTVFKGSIESFDWLAGFGWLYGGIFISKQALGVYEGGDFRRFTAVEVMPCPQQKQGVVYRLDKKDAGRAYWWALPGTPAKKFLPAVGTIEISRVVRFIRDRRFGFITDPCGGEDLHIHLNEAHRYSAGKLLSLYAEPYAPLPGERVVFMRGANGRVEKWARVQTHSLVGA